MAGTREGGLKAATTNRKLHGKNFYSVIGSEGGKAKHPNKGFGRDDRTLFQKIRGVPSRASLAGRKGGTISKRGKAIAR